MAATTRSVRKQPSWQHQSVYVSTRNEAVDNTVQTISSFSLKIFIVISRNVINPSITVHIVNRGRWIQEPETPSLLRDPRVEAKTRSAQRRIMASWTTTRTSPTWRDDQRRFESTRLRQATAGRGVGFTKKIAKGAKITKIAKIQKNPV